MIRLAVNRSSVHIDGINARIGTVSEGCPNTWHNTADYRGKTACPECPSAIGLRIAIQQLRSAAVVRESGGDDPSELRSQADDLEDLLYHAPEEL